MREILNCWGMGRPVPYFMQNKRMKVRREIDGGYIRIILPERQSLC